MTQVCERHATRVPIGECAECQENERYKQDALKAYTGVCIKHGRYVRRGLAQCPYCAGAKPWSLRDEERKTNPFAWSGEGLAGIELEEQARRLKHAGEAADASIERGRLPYKGRPYLPTDASARKDIPVMTGFLDYFPLAACEVAKLSKKGNDQHNPGEPLHWARSKSTDEADTAIRHLMERGGVDTDGVRHTAKAAWRVLALLQKELEEASGLPISRASQE